MRENISENIHRERNYGLDLFRFISMLMIVGLHVIGNGGILDNAQPLTIRGEAVWLLEIACYCSVNCFALASGYVGVHSKHKWNNIVSLSSQVIFYCVVFTTAFIFISLIQHEPISITFIAKSLVPTLFRRYWYFSAYFCLFFFMPILDRIVDMPKPILKRSAIILFVVFICVTQVYEHITNLSLGFSFLWLAILYVIGGYMAKHNFMRNLSPGKSLLGYFICIVATSGFKILLDALNLTMISNTMPIPTYTSPTTVFAALFLLNAFVNLNIGKKYRSVILFLSSCSFGVYIIHCHPIIYDNLLKNAFVWIWDYNVFVLIGFILIASIIIYLICSLIEALRKKIFKWTKLDALVDAISKLISKVVKDV